MSLFMNPRPLAHSDVDQKSVWRTLSGIDIGVVESQLFHWGYFLRMMKEQAFLILQTPVQLSLLNGTTFQLCSKDKVAPLTGLSRTWSRPLSTSSDISFLVVQFGKFKKKNPRVNKVSYPILSFKQYCPPWLQTKTHHASVALQ